MYVCHVKEIPKRYYCGEPHDHPPGPYTTDNRNAFRRHLTLKHDCDLKPYSDEIEVLYGERLRRRQSMCQRGQRHTRRRATGQLSVSEPMVPQHSAASQPVAGQLQFVELYEPSTDFGYIRSISTASSTSFDVYYQSVAAATSATAATISTASAPPPMPAGMEEEGEDDSSLWGPQPSSQSSASHRPWLSPSRFLSSDIGVQTVGPPLSHTATQTDPYERVWRPPYRLSQALEFIRAASASYPGHTPLQLAHIVYRWLNLSTTLDWYFLSTLVQGIIQAEQQLTTSLLASVSAARAVDPTGITSLATVAAELARRSVRPMDDGGVRFEPELPQLADAVITID